MINEIRKYIVSVLLRLSLYLLPKGEFKNKFSFFLYNEIINDRQVEEVKIYIYELGRTKTRSTKASRK